MRGGAQCHLVEAEDGHCYVLKPRNNPQHRRVLVNEWIASVFLRYLRIASPETAVLDVSPAVLEQSPDFNIQIGSKTIPIEVGWHFGSRFPGDPARVTVYDFLPDSMLDSIANPHDFLGALVFDKWISNADARQAIFLRANIRPVHPGPDVDPARPGFAALMIDHGFCLQGPNWDFVNSPPQGLYHRRSIYQSVTGWASFEPWLDWIRNFPEHVADEALSSIPESWLDGDYDALVSVLEKLMRRRSRVGDWIEDSRNDRLNPFPNWR
jgi:hypothetical protein